MRGPREQVAKVRGPVSGCGVRRKEAQVGRKASTHVHPFVFLRCAVGNQSVIHRMLVEISPQIHPVCVKAFKAFSTSLLAISQWYMHACLAPAGVGVGVHACCT